MPATITYDSISSLKYLSHVMPETLRLYSSISMMLHVDAHDASLIGAFVLKAISIMLPMFAVNRSVEMCGYDAEGRGPGLWAKVELKYQLSAVIGVHSLGGGTRR
ncbi:hypothetical protein HOY82DRAFT_639150 [Tuber indicum]|nr:hypothetical protein HOY82DRAFT_639150 [Tuber indicum]